MAEIPTQDEPNPTGGRDHGELVSRPKQTGTTRILAERIITAVQVKGDGGDPIYHFYHIIDDKDQIGDLLNRTEEIPPMLLHMTESSFLPKIISHAKVPEYGILPDILKTVEPDGQEDQPGVHVLLSEKSGTGLARSFYDYVLEPFLEKFLRLVKGVDFDVHTTTDPRDDTAKNFARDVLLPAANKGKKRTVILCSGDGGIVDLLNGPLRCEARESTYVAPTICLMPLGTGNALFHSLHRPLRLLVPGPPKAISATLVDALRTMLDGYSHPLPTFTATFSPGARVLVNESREAIPFPPFPDPSTPHLNVLYGAVVASYGFHSTLVADSDTTEYRKHGIARFGMVAKELLGDPKGPHPYKCRIAASFPESTNNSKNILTDGTKEFGYILCTLISNLEETFTISPESKPMDGKLRAVCFGDLSGEDVQKVMMGAYQGGVHVKDESVTYEAVDRLRIDLEEEGPGWKWRRCCIDGQIVAIEEGGWMTVTNGGVGSRLLDILVPPPITTGAASLRAA